uniref:Uncharacterized protein n=1 Tax=Mycena chlorophos TaxID=658473 RepID=A0ABQ0M5W7_MYCCL|nr:predicted protein [Mycena chlorophos]
MCTAANGSSKYLLPAMATSAEHPRRRPVLHTAPVLSNLGTVAYFFARLATLVFCVLAAIFVTYPVQNCHLMLNSVMVGFSVSQASTAFLFFMRVAAIYDRNRVFHCILFTLWLGALGGSTLVAIGGTGANIGPTAYCTIGATEDFVGITPILVLIHDTVVFFAITYRLFMSSFPEPEVESTRRMAALSIQNIHSFFTGKYLGAFSRAVLHDGQFYYLVSGLSNILSMILLFRTGIPTQYKVAFGVPSMAFENLMAGIVYRNTKFGYRMHVIRTSELMSRAPAGATSHSIVFRQPGSPKTYAPTASTSMATDSEKGAVVRGANSHADEL